TTPATVISAWGVFGRNEEGDQAAPEGWPAAGSYDSAESLPDVFRPAPFPESPVGYAATTGGPLGCQVANLPPCHDNWGALTYDRIVLPAIDVLRGPAPAIPPSNDGRYSGEVLDLTRIDLGEHLRAVQESRKLAPQVVIHLHGSG